ncbi:response regulator, partial [Magnetococcales bacterium HHB-1]
MRKKKILLVEDSVVLAKLIRRRLNTASCFDIIHTSSYRETETILQQEEPENFFLALLDLVLPDAKEGEIVDYICQKSIPAIVFTSMYSDDLRDYMESKGVIDYVVKRSRNVEQIGYLVERLAKNRNISILVVDDSRTQRAALRKLLELYQFCVYEAENGMEAIKILSEDNDIRLVITDYIMPEMDGFALLEWIRYEQGKSRNELAAIGLSAHGSNILSARFIKGGGNDFLSKPYLKEELICRVFQNIETLELIDTINETAQKD